MSWANEPAKAEASSPQLTQPPTQEESSGVLAALRVGLRLALFGRPPVAGSTFSASDFWALVVLAGLASCGLSWLSAEEPRRFELHALESDGFYTLFGLFLCFIVTRRFRQPEKLWALATLSWAAGIYIGSVVTLAWDHLLPDLMEKEAKFYWYALALTSIWYVGVWGRTFEVLGLGQRRLTRLAAAIFIVGSSIGLQWEISPTRYWEKDWEAEYEAKHENAPAPLIAEEVFGQQSALLAHSLERIKRGRPGVPDLYFVAFAPYGRQDVFLKETLYSTHLFETRFGATGRSIALVNNRKEVQELPSATVTNLHETLNAIGKRMNTTEDILFLFMTSHGSRDGEMSIELGDLSFKPLTGPVLADLLRESGIRWRVLVVSSCYSGTFLPALKDDHTLVITASRADRTSFGCSDDAEMTNFGRAYFEQALNRTSSFTEAYGIAQKLVSEWESRDHQQRSEPQIQTGALIEAKLKAWQSTLPRRTSQTVTSH